MTATIRPCRADDAETLVNLIRELAVYENLEEFAQANSEQVRAHFFGPRPFAEAILAEVEGEAVGFAIFFGTYSTFRGQPGMYLEDIFVREEHREKGIGRALLATLARIAVDCGCGRVEWSVLDWNEPAMGFYRSLGALPLDQWTMYRIDDEPLARLADQAPPFDGETPGA